MQYYTPCLDFKIRITKVIIIIILVMPAVRSLLSEATALSGLKHVVKTQRKVKQNY